MSDDIDPGELDKWQRVSDAAKAHGWQAFRVTPDFLDRLIARVRELTSMPSILADERAFVAVTEERDELQARVAEQDERIDELEGEWCETLADLEAKTAQVEKLIDWKKQQREEILSAQVGAWRKAANIAWRLGIHTQDSPIRRDAVAAIDKAKALDTEATASEKEGGS